ncbi:hypothetical protein [Agrococcus baldri]|uniref:Uncharacterized protein n=1 Tax=Agrococcus baldri TaxID=153730 RepID=A0AA87USN4_9MICO|nr:hypothetical protein [Agrococcus baldri]GEK81121.1 hypothetical protein ABA31_24720 [Agrococcus baldri]
MRYRWDEGAVTADGEEVARTGPGFWGLAPAFALGGAEWSYRNESEGLIGARDGIDVLSAERGRIWDASWRLAGLRGPMSLTRTSSWLLGKLRFDLERDGDRIAEVIPEGPWQYRPSLEVTGALDPAEAVFVLWVAARIDGRRPQRRIRPDGGMGGTAGGPA